MQVSQLFYYPVKSLGSVSVQSMRVTDWGPHRDRRMMLVDANGKFVTQRQCHLMSLIRVEDSGHQIRFILGERYFDLPWPDFAATGGDSLAVTVWDDSVAARSVSKAADAWFSDVMQRDVRLVLVGEETLRQVDLAYARQGDKTGFSDGFPFLLISEASLLALQSHLPFELSMTRFRPNLVVSGCEPFAEDRWRRIAINGIEFEIVKPCSRCVIPTLNPVDGVKQPEVMKVLLEHRKQGNQVFVGQNVIHRAEGEIAVGMSVEVLESI